MLTPLKKSGDYSVHTIFVLASTQFLSGVDPSIVLATADFNYCYCYSLVTLIHVQSRRRAHCHYYLYQDYATH